MCLLVLVIEACLHKQASIMIKPFNHGKVMTLLKGKKVGSEKNQWVLKRTDGKAEEDSFFLDFMFLQRRKGTVFFGFYVFG